MNNSALKMVKLEHANIFSPVSPDVPPGFPPHPPQTSTSEAGAVDSSLNQNPTSKEHFSIHMHEQRQGPDFLLEQLPRRSSRKRSRPKLYVPPPASRRGRGRPPKSRLMSQFSYREKQTRNANEVSSTSSQRSEKQIPSSVPSVQRITEQPSSQAINHQQPTEASNPVNGCERATKVGRKNKMRGSNDPKILQHVANSSHCMSGTEISMVGNNLKSRFSDLDDDLACTLEAINKKHGDITQGCSLESECMKTLVLFSICKVVQDLQEKRLEDLDVNSLDSCYTVVRDAENMKVNVKWLRNRLDEIKNAVKLSNEATAVANERTRRLQNIHRKEKELERLKSEVQIIEAQIAQETVEVHELSKRFGHWMSGISRFQNAPLMDALI